MHHIQTTLTTSTKLVSTVSICLALTFCGCGKEKTNTAEQERKLDEKISAVNAEIAEARAAKEGVKQSSDLYKAAANKQHELTLQRDELQAEKDRIAKEKEQQLANAVSGMADKLPQADASVQAWIAAHNDYTEGGVIPLLKQDWIGTNASGILVGLNRQGGTDSKEFFQTYLLSSGTANDIEEGKQAIDPNTDITLQGVNSTPAFKVRGYQVGGNIRQLEGVLLSTNRLRIYFPEKPLGTVDFYPKP